jgi:hypothetical protein
MMDGPIVTETRSQITFIYYTLFQRCGAILWAIHQQPLQTVQIFGAKTNHVREPTGMF